MKTDDIYKILAEVTGQEKEYLELGRSVQLVRPWEVVEVVEIVLNKLVEIRDNLYNSLPTGEIKDWDWLQLVKNHLTELDKLIDKIQQNHEK